MTGNSPSNTPDGQTQFDGVDSTGVTVEGLFDDLAGLSGEDAEADLHEEVRDVTELLTEAHERGLIDSGVRHLRAKDAAEAFIGSVIFASPLLVEDGIFEIGEYLFTYTVFDIPIFLIVNTLFVVFMTYALLEWTGRNVDESSTVFGVIPLRVFMILTVSFLVATLLMAVWGRIDIWGSPTEALARINVIWTVGSLGAALGDILSDNSPDPATIESHRPTRSSDHGTAAVTVEQSRTETPDDEFDQLTDGELVEELGQQFDELESTVDTDAERRTVQRLREESVQAAIDDAFGSEISKYTSRDIAEAFVGSIFFAIPFLVEDGVFDVAEYFLSFRIGLFPVFFLLNAAFVIGMIYALVYWAGPQEVQITRPIFGLIPRRLVGIAVVSFLTAAALMTMWGRVDNWQEPVVALARISVVWTVASFGAALGDILPGESSGTDINDDLAAFGDRIGDDTE